MHSPLFQQNGKAYFFENENSYIFESIRFKLNRISLIEVDTRKEPKLFYF